MKSGEKYIFIPVISGGVSLGSYEAGVMYALLMAQRLGEITNDYKIIIPALSGTSAGAITALISSFIITDGLSPNILKTVWVELMSIDNFLEFDGKGILSREKLIKEVKETIKNYWNVECKREFGLECKTYLKNGCSIFKCRRRIQEDPVDITVTLTNLFGRREYLYDRNKERIEIVYKDSLKFSRERMKDLNDMKDEWFDYAAASSSIGVIFHFVTLKRKKEEYKYIVDDYKKEIYFDYIDGGLLNNRPVNYAVDMALELSYSNPTILLIEPAINEEKQKKKDPVSILLRIWTKLSSYRDIIEDVRGIKKMNDRIDSIDSFYKKLAKALENTENIKHLMNIFGGYEYKEKRELFEQLTNNKDIIAILEGIALQIEKSMGIKGKKHFDIEFINSTDERLSGDFLNHFGGFFEKKLRMNDFIMGIRDTRKVLKEKYQIELPIFNVESEFDEKYLKFSLKNLNFRQWGNIFKFLINACRLLVFKKRTILKFIFYLFCFPTIFIIVIMAIVFIKLY